jgi:hypothetical protein
MHDLIDIAEALLDTLTSTDAAILQTAMDNYKEAERKAASARVADIKKLRTETNNLSALVSIYSESDDDEGFTKKTAIHEYLLNKGYKVGERTLYDHIKFGKLQASSDDGGVFLKSDVDEYAERYLRQTANKSSEQQRVEADVDLKRERARRERLQNDVMEGKLISREKVGAEFASRIMEMNQAHEGLVNTLPHELAGKSEPEIRDILKEAFRRLFIGYCRKLEEVDSVS